MHIYKAARGEDNSLISQELAHEGIQSQNDYQGLLLLTKDDGTNYWGGASKGYYCQFTGNAQEGWLVVGCANRQLAWQYVNWYLNPRSTEYAQRVEH